MKNFFVIFKRFLFCDKSENNNLAKSNNLKRNFFIKRHKLVLSTKRLNGLHYAFYLKHPNGIEKSFYTHKAKCFFDIPLEKGVYEAIYFYKQGNKRLSFKEFFVLNENKKLSSVNKTSVAETKNWKIDYYDNKSDITFIVFNGAGSIKNTTPFGFGYLINNGYNVVACMQNNDQYQSLSLESFKNYVLPLVSEKKVFLYGSSLGGYCAVYYAGAVNGVVIAAAPRNSAHPIFINKAGGKSKFSNIVFNHKDIKDNVKTSREIYLLFDPYSIDDIYFINNFIRPVYPNLIEFSFDHAGHEVLFHVNKTNQLDALISSIVLNQRFDINRDIDSCYTYIGKSIWSLSNNDDEDAVFYSKKALEDETLSSKVRFRFVNIYEQAIKLRDANSK